MIAKNDCAQDAPMVTLVEIMPEDEISLTIYGLDLVLRMSFPARFILADLRISSFLMLDF